MKHSHYFKNVQNLHLLDVYKVCELFDIQDPSGALQHAIKKLLVAGGRGAKDKQKDIREAVDTLQRYLDSAEADLGKYPKVAPQPIQYPGPKATSSVPQPAPPYAHSISGDAMGKTYINYVEHAAEILENISSKGSTAKAISESLREVTKHTHPIIVHEGNSYIIHDEFGTDCLRTYNAQSGAGVRLFVVKRTFAHKLGVIEDAD
ncbi:phosphodiesterase [Alteromonas phage vB_AcoS-R7M]|uniref:Phosphodiesterase n=1 Tax=Alteromonas phage vB_AcoS-R7M TaxID=2729541 RepID=A0A6M3YTD0_9CAUD|nr:phosphodiesterase [Alteromonas phage vB_AcoS-R7M]QJI53336.1 phosphodiesterase [Alteromonas phage vB_AcoS-R7M]